MVVFSNSCVYFLGCFTTLLKCEHFEYLCGGGSLCGLEFGLRKSHDLVVVFHEVRGGVAARNKYYSM